MDSFYSNAESPMEEDPSHHRCSTAEDGVMDSGDPTVWAAFNENFRQVQSVLDRNRVLIAQVNENQQSRIRNNMVQNVSLIKELNGNISKVVSLYTHLNSNFSTAFQQQHSKNSATNVVARDKS